MLAIDADSHFMGPLDLFERYILSSLPAESVDKILCVNARRFYRIS